MCYNICIIFLSRSSKLNEFNTLNTGVFDKFTGHDTLSDRAFYLLMGVLVIYGLVLTLIISGSTSQNEDFMNWLFKLVSGMGSTRDIGNMIASILIFLGLFLICPVIGSFIAQKSDNALVSFFGYNLIVVPFGLLNSVLFLAYESNSIFSVFFLTLIATVVMCAAGAAFPEFFSKIGGALFIALLGLIVAMIINSMFFGPSTKAGIIEYLGAGIFCLYIGFDFWRATEIDKTADNAVDVAIQLYLDILNLFLFMMKIFGKARSS